MYKKIQRLDKVLNLDYLLSCQALLTITLECFLCLCETEIDSYCAWVILSISSNWMKISFIFKKIGPSGLSCFKDMDICYVISCTSCESKQVRIQDLVKGGAPASEAESCRHSEAESCERSEHSVAGVQGPLKGPGSFWVFDAQICILTHSRDSFSLIFDIYFDTKSW